MHTYPAGPAPRGEARGINAWSPKIDCSDAGSVTKPSCPIFVGYKSAIFGNSFTSQSIL